MDSSQMVLILTQFQMLIEDRDVPLDRSTNHNDKWSHLGTHPNKTTNERRATLLRTPTDIQRRWNDRHRRQVIYYAWKSERKLRYVADWSRGRHDKLLIPISQSRSINIHMMCIIQRSPAPDMVDIYERCFCCHCCSVVCGPLHVALLLNVFIFIWTNQRIDRHAKSAHAQIVPGIRRWRHRSMTHGRNQ